MTFQQDLIHGQAGESAISQWLQCQGCTVLPAYEKIFDTGKGPQLYTAHRNFVSPDLLVFGGGQKSIFFAEVKHKTRFTWHRNSQTWQTGIDLRHYLDYCEVESITGLPVWLMFLHTDSEPSQSDLTHGAPKTCPSGLFGNALSDLMLAESHRSQRHGTSGMVYWPESALMKLAD